MKHMIGAVLALNILAPAAMAKPILNDSQQSYYSACIADSSEAQRQLELCQTALSDTALSASQRIDVQIEVGDALYSLSRYDDSETVYLQILSQAPDKIAALNGLAWVHWSRDEYDQAVEIFQTSVQRGPSAQAMAGLASSHRHLDNISAEEFSELLDVAVALDPDYSWAIREKGWGLNDFGLHDQAEIAFRMALEHEPNNQWTVYGLAYTLNELDRHKDALDVLLSVEQNDTTPTGFYSQLSLARFYVGDYKDALKQAERTIQGWPDSSTGYVRKARALSALGQRTQAIEVLKTRNALGHDGFVAYWLADILDDDGQTAAALDVMNVTLRTGKADRHDFELHAYLSLEVDDHAAARRSVKEALKLNPAAPYVLYYQALLMVHDGDYDASEQVMAQSLENGAPPSLSSEYVKALVAEGQFTRAIRWRVGAREKAAREHQENK